MYMYVALSYSELYLLGKEYVMNCVLILHKHFF